MVFKQTRDIPPAGQGIKRVYIAGFIFSVFIFYPAFAQGSDDVLMEAEKASEPGASSAGNPTDVGAPGDIILNGDFNIEDEFQNDFEDDFEDEFGAGSPTAIYDPLRGYNRMMTTANDKFYFWILRPTAKGYEKVVPRGIRRSANRFFLNLAFPIRFVNNILQFKLREAGVELTRFTVNTTIGVAGLWDPANKWFGLQSHPEDFGQTLGHYGLGSGFYFVLPFLGASNLRDLVGASADAFTDPVCYLGNCYAGYWPAASGLKAYDLFNETSLRIGEYESLKKDAFDFYIFLRDTSEDSRNKEISE